MPMDTGVPRKTLSLCPDCNREAVEAVLKGEIDAADFRDNPGIIEAEILEEGGRMENALSNQAHRRFVDGTRAAFQKWALQKLGRQVPVGAISPRAIDGVQLLPIPVPPMFEEALGYRGASRLVEFGYSRVTRQFVYGDGGDNIPSDESLWIRFLRHPVVAPHLAKSKYPTLHGMFPEREVENRECKADIRNIKSPTDGLRFHDLRHHAITELAESQASDQTVMAIAGHVSPKMLAHYSHVRMQAKRKALDALLVARSEGDGHGTNSDTNDVPVTTSYPQVIEKMVGPWGLEPQTSTVSR